MADPLKVLEELGEEVERLARADAARRGRSSRGRAVVLAVVLAAVLSGVALAASGLLEGDPVAPPKGMTFAPDRGLGVPLADSVRLSALRVPDPAGGPPWGLRTLRTTRGLGCVQVGRVVDGRLGVLGQDGAFADDGRFHPLPAGVITQAYCERLDAAGRTYVAVSYRGFPASGLPGACLPERHAPAPPGAPRQHPNVPPCPREDLRILYFGLLGPQAENVTYRAGGVTRSAPTSGPDGAYLVVALPDRSRRPDGQFVVLPSPGSGLSRVEYRDGRACRIRSPRSIGGAQPCPRVGYAPIRARAVSRAQVATRVRARRDGGRVRVAFRARVAANASRAYVVSVRPERVRDCGFALISGAIARDVPAGEVVTETISVPPRCRERLRGVVFLNTDDARTPQSAPPLPEPGQGDPVVGRFTTPPP